MPVFFGGNGIPLRRKKREYTEAMADMYVRVG